MKCSDVERVLPELLDGAPDGAYQTEFENHLKSCPVCSDLVSDLKLITSEWKLDPLEIAVEGLHEGRRGHIKRVQNGCITARGRTRSGAGTKRVRVRVTRQIPTHP